MPLALRALVAETGALVAAHALILVVPLVFLRLVLGPRPFARVPERTVPRFLVLGVASALLALIVNTLLDAAGVTGRLLGRPEPALSFLRAVFVSFVLAGV